MKTLMNTFFGVAVAIMGAMTVISCDPCAGVVCNNGTCSNGTCVCETGYEKKGTECVGVNMKYVGDGEVSATVLAVDSTGAQISSTSNVAYTINASATNSYSFTIKNFLNLANNDIALSASTNNFDIIPLTTVNTSYPKTYTVNGGKSGNQVSLTIKDVSTKITYTLAYTAE